MIAFFIFSGVSVFQFKSEQNKNQPGPTSKVFEVQAVQVSNLDNFKDALHIRIIVKLQTFSL